VPYGIKFFLYQMLQKANDKIDELVKNGIAFVKVTKNC